jgi:hypothetical protein
VQTSDAFQLARLKSDAKGVGGLQLTLPDRSSEDVRNLSRPAITI